MLAKALTVKGLAALGVLALGGVSAAGATGNLPDAAQDGLANAASHVGVTLPASHENHPSKDRHPGESDDAPVTPTTGANHGSEVSDAAHATYPTGRDKGEAVSTVARGDHGGPPASVGQPDVTPNGNSPSTGAPVPTPNEGGIGTGSTASDGANATGTDHAAPQAADGSANAGDHPSGP
jgi:hypothetical protein